MNTTKEQAIIHFNDGNKLYKGNLHQEAFAEYEKAIQLDPTFYDAHFCLAKSLVRLNKIEDGVTHFKKYSDLIPGEKRANYILALSKIINEANAPKVALNLLEASNISFSNPQKIEYATLLFSNNNINAAIHQLLNISEKEVIKTGYQQLLQNTNIPKTIISNLQNENTVPRFLNTAKKIQVLKSVPIQNKDFSALVENGINSLKATKESQQTNYTSEINKGEELAIQAQNVLASHCGILIKTSNISQAKKALAVLQQTNYDPQITTEIKNQISEIEKTKTNKTVKFAGLIAAAIVILGVAGYFGYNAYQKFDAREYALSSNSIASYTSYLNKYGSDTEIDKLCEDKLYQKAVTSNDAKDFAQLSRLYGNSKYLRSIRVEVTGSTSHSKRAYGLGNINQNTDVTGGKILSFKAPVGAKVGYSITSNNSIPINRVLTVTEDLKITEQLTVSKELIFEENFNSNTNGWPTSNASKQVYGRTKYRSVNVSNGELQFNNDYNENAFTFSTVKLSKLKKQENFEIEASITRNKKDKGTFILFGGTTRGFNYFGFNNKYSYGYNNWDNPSDNWINVSNGWKYNKNLNKGDYATNVVKINNQNGNLTFTINNSYLGSMPIKRWYGNRIGFGINNNTSSKINYLKVYKNKNRAATKFKEDNTYFCWVDELNVRANSTKKGKVLATIKLAEPVKFLGGKGKKPLNATFKGVFSPDYYYEVELLDGTIGWVHGGALKGIPSDKKIDFESFRKNNIPATITQTPSSDASEFYMIAVYAESNETNITKRVQELKSKNYTANYLWIPDYKSLSSAEMYSAYIGPFSTKEACKKALNNVKKHYPKAYGLLASKNTAQRIMVN